MNKKTRKAQRLANLKEFPEQMEKLQSLGYDVHRFLPPPGATDVRHHRINGFFDIWPSTKRWLDRRTYEKGHYENLVEFVENNKHLHPGDMKRIVPHKVLSKRRRAKTVPQQPSSLQT